jgi:hypothetical protein
MLDAQQIYMQQILDGVNQCRNQLETPRSGAVSSMTVMMVTEPFAQCTRPCLPVSLMQVQHA